MVATKVGWHVLVKAEAATGGARRAAFTRACHPTTIGHRGRRLACIYRRTEGSTRIVDLCTRSLFAIYWQVYVAGNRIWRSGRSLRIPALSHSSSMSLTVAVMAASPQRPPA